MKKIKLIIISIVLFFVTLQVQAMTFSVSSTQVTVGDTFTVNVSFNGIAAWSVHVNPSGPVSGCVINQADATSDALNANKSFSTTCTATGEGAIVLALTGDTTNEDGIIEKLSGSRTVTVVKKEVIPTPTPDPTPAPNPTPAPDPTPVIVPVPSSNTNQSVPKSSNVNLRKIEVDGYNLTKVDDTHYTLSVSSSTESINISADVADTKGTVEGVGVKKLVEGDNNFTVTVKAEDGSIKEYYLKVVKEKEEVKKEEKVDEVESEEEITTTGTDGGINYFILIICLIPVILITFAVIFLILKKNSSDDSDI